MADIQQNQKGGNAKIVSGILAAGLSSYLMNWFSLHGVDFEALGFPSEMVKASLIGTLTGLFVGLTPHNFVQYVIAVIYFIRTSYRKIVSAATTDKLPTEGDEQ